jgi:hypothetical protein
MWYNPIIKFLLLSPFHAFISKSILLLTYKGCRSAQEYSTPLTYVRDNNEYLLLALSRRMWWRNFRSGAPVTIRVKGRDVSGIAQVISQPPEAVQAALNTYLKSQKDLARILKVRYDAEGEPDRQALEKAAENRVLVRILVES